jgi:hypothetical protein
MFYSNHINLENDHKYKYAVYKTKFEYSAWIYF